MSRSSVRIIVLVAVPWLLLLVASHAVRGTRQPFEPSGPGVELASVGDGADGRRVFVAYREWRPAPRATDDESAPRESRAPLLLLHGSPGSSADFSALLPQLAREWRTIVPDLPGFGRSTRDVPDYSVEAHARYALELLDALEIDRAHVVGFSMGGGVGLELAALAPRRLRSLTLLSSIGAVEYELLGAQLPNRIVHGLQLAALWSLRELVPHFGLLDDGFFGVPYARNFSDTDQSRLRTILEQLELPLSIVHGEHDFLVPVAAARESARLVPQASLVELDASHFIVFSESEMLGPPLLDFFERVEAGLAPRRADADADRVARAAAGFDPASVPPVEAVSWIVLTAAVAIVAAVSGPGGAAMAGTLLGFGRFGFAGALSGVLAGLLLGVVLRALARTLGPTPTAGRRRLLYVVLAFVVGAALALLVVALRGGPIAPVSALTASLGAAAIATAVAWYRSDHAAGRRGGPDA